MGEWYAGQRLVGAGMLAAFCGAALWLLVGSYGAVQELSEKVKRDDPTLAAVPQDPAEAGSIILRLYPAILAEYSREKAKVHQKVAIPLYSIFFLYALSMALAVYYAWEAGKGATPAGPPPSPPGGKPTPAAP